MEIVARFQNLGRGKETRRSLLSDRGGGATKFWSGREKEEEALQIEISRRRRRRRSCWRGKFKFLRRLLPPHLLQQPTPPRENSSGAKIGGEEREKSRKSPTLAIPTNLHAKSVLNIFVA